MSAHADISGHPIVLNNFSGIWEWLSFFFFFWRQVEVSETPLDDSFKVTMAVQYFDDLLNNSTYAFFYVILFKVRCLIRTSVAYPTVANLARFGISFHF